MSDSLFCLPSYGTCTILHWALYVNENILPCSVMLDVRSLTKCSREDALFFNKQTLALELMHVNNL